MSAAWRRTAAGPLSSAGAAGAGGSRPRSSQTTDVCFSRSWGREAQGRGASRPRLAKDFAVHRRLAFAVSSRGRGGRARSGASFVRTLIPFCPRTPRNTAAISTRKFWRDTNIHAAVPAHRHAQRPAGGPRPPGSRHSGPCRVRSSDPHRGALCPQPAK